MKYNKVKQTILPVIKERNIARVIYLVLGLASIGICACMETTASYAQPAVELKKMLADVISEYNAPGAAIAVKFADGSVFQHSAGIADKQSSEPLTIEHYFRIGSVSKTFTAKAVLLLYQDGLLTLDTPVESILPDLTAFAPMHGKGITVRTLLNNTSGLDDYVGLPYENSYFFYVLTDNMLRQWSPEELVAISVNHGLQSPPGENFLYSNTNYILLGLIIEKLSGKKYETFLKERLFDPLGLEHTSVPVTTGFPGTFAHGYYEKKSDGELYDYSIQNPSGVWSAGNIISTVPDILKWLESLIKGELLSTRVKDEQFNFPVSDGFGYGLGILSMNNSIGHNGSVLGYQIQMFEYKGAFFVIYTNCYYSTKENVSQVIFERAKKIIFPD